LAVLHVLLLRIASSRCMANTRISCALERLDNNRWCAL